MKYRRSSSFDLLGMACILMGCLMLFYVLSKLLWWLLLAGAGYYLLSMGLRLNGYPSINYFVSRILFRNFY